MPGLVVGDGLLCIGIKKTALSPITPPAGYATHVDNGSTGIFSKIADAGDVSATIHDFIFASGLSSERAVLMRFTDVDPAGFVDNFSTVGSGFNPIVCPALVASRSARFVIAGVGNSSFNRGGSSHTGPAGFTERDDGVFFELSLGVYTKDVLAVSIGTENIIPSQAANLIAQGSTIALLGPIPTVTQAQVKARREQLMSKGRRLMVIISDPTATPLVTDPIFLVKDPDAGRGGFGKPPESASDAQGDANDGWKIYSFDDAGTAYNL